jgi:hypothetical protein
LNKYLYIDSENRVCRIDADTGAMIPVEWSQPDVDAARKRYEAAKADLLSIWRSSIPFGPGSGSPIFEVIIGNPASPDHVYRIWADGKTEGFGEGAMIRNRIPLALSGARGFGPAAYGIAPVAT